MKNVVAAVFVRRKFSQPEMGIRMKHYPYAGERIKHAVAHPVATVGNREKTTARRY
jgi:hypothetical protein